MKATITVVFLFMSLSALRAQRDVDAGTEGITENSPYLFPAWNRGVVHFKTGDSRETLLNYNVLFQQMIFNDGKSMLALDKLPTIDTVRIAGRKFVVVDTIFYEVASASAAVPLYIHYRAQLVLAGTNIGFGSSNQTAPSENLESFRIGNVTPYDTKIPDKYKVERQVEFLVKKKDGFLVLTGAKQLGDVFPGKEKMIRQYMRDHEIAWGKVEDMEKLFVFCNVSMQ